MTAILDQVRTRPVAVVLQRVPLVASVLDGTFDGIVEVQAFRTHGGAVGLAYSLEPDAVVTEGDYTNVLVYVPGAGSPVFEVDLERGTFERRAGLLRVARAALRNAVVGALRSGA